MNRVVCLEDVGVQIKWVLLCPPTHSTITPANHLITVGNCVTSVIIRRWCGQQAVYRKTVRGAASSVILSACGRILAVGFEAGMMILYEAESGIVMQSVKVSDIPRGLRCRFSPDGAFITVERSDTVTVDQTVIYARSTGALYDSCRPEVRYYWRLAVFSPDNQLLAVAEDKDIILRTRNAPVYYSCMSGHERSVTYLAFSADGQHLASTSVDNTTRVWCVPKRLCAYVLRGHAGTVKYCAFSGDLLVTMSSDGTARVWRGTTGVWYHGDGARPTVPVRTISLARGACSTFQKSCGFTADGLLALIRDGQRVTVYCTRTWRVLHSMPSDCEPVPTAAGIVTATGHVLQVTPLCSPHLAAHVLLLTGRRRMPRTQPAPGLPPEVWRYTLRCG